MMKFAFNPFKGLLFGMFVLLCVSSASLAADPLQAPVGNMGGGEIRPPQDDISPAVHQQINRGIDATRTRLEALRILSPRNAAPRASGMVSGFAWPLRQAAGRTDNSYYGIANFVDQDPLYAADQSHVKDYFCGSRSYDTAAGYNHQGTDIFSWPFGWKKMDNNDVEIVAGADGIIIGKDDGNFDRSCSMNGSRWNAVYVQHADGSVAWYGHMKNGSLTSKAVGAPVSVGEYLGIVGSSGSSTGPHLHLELYDAGNNLVDPWMGACNTKSQELTWSHQLPYYDLAINAITVGPAAPDFPDCPTAEISNDTGYVVPGSVGYFTVYLRDQRSMDVVSARWYQPDGSLWKTATSGVPSSYYASAYWYWYYTFPTSPTGIWRFEATVNGKTVSKNFPVGDSATPCSYTLSASSAAFSASLTHGSVSVASNAGCAWTATSSESWITITSGASGSGDGGVAYAVAANTGTTGRTGTLTIAGQTFTVAQAAAAPVCTLSANPATITAGASATLTAGCTPAVTSYTWTGGTCAGTIGATCTVTPTGTTTYSVTGINAEGTGAAASATVTVNACTYILNTDSAAAPATAGTGSISVTSSCAWTATSNASWITITSGASGSGNGTVAYAVAANTGTTGRTGTLTIAGQTFTVTQAAGSTVAAPVCTLSANPASITAGGSSTLMATCSPAAINYTWTGGTCAGTTSATCTVKPTATTTYSVQGSNASGTHPAASATVTVTANATSYTVPGTLGNDVFVLTAGNNYYGGAGNDTFIISTNTLRGDVTAKIVDSEGDNLVQLVDGMTVAASSFYADAAQLTLSTGAKVQILGASKFKYQVGANALAGDTAPTLTYSEFVTSLGASLSGTLPASGTAGYVVPTGFTQASAPVPSVAGSSYTVPGTIGDDVLAPLGGNNYLGGGGNDTYIISSYTLSGAVTAKIIDSEGANVVQLVKGLTIASSSFFSNAVQLTLSNGAKVQILGASGFSYQLGANASAGETATSLSYAQFAAALGASVPTGTSAVSGSTNFLVN